MEEGAPQARRLALALAALGCQVFPASPQARPRRVEFYFVRYDIYPVAAPAGHMEILAGPPGRVLRPGRTLFVQAGREASVRWKEACVRLRPRGRNALESGDGSVVTPPPGWGVLVGLEEASAFVRVEPVE